jgi:Bacterial surface proteins containing Ig-like domains
MALNCASSKFVGKSVLAEFALACGDVDPMTLTWLPLGAARNKSLTMSADTVDATADDSVGSFRDTLITYKTFEVSIDGVTKRDDGTTSNQQLLFEHFVTDPQPYVWIRLTGPINTVIGFCVLTEFSQEFPYDDIATYSITASATSRPGGLASVIVEDTPIAVTSVVTTPATATVAVGNVTNIDSAVLPAAANQAVVWTSGTPANATVNSSGRVTGVAVGTSTITATSVVDPTKSDTTVVTVVA